jgi:TolA-binding protein
VDCEKFDQIVLDLLYDELSEITSAAAKRHMEHCARCKEIGTRLRATREVGALPLLDAPQGLELRILEAERRARRELPARQRVGRAVSMLAGYAMRPQLAMAALLLLVIGSSLLLLRARPGEQKSMMVTERGVPEGEPETVAVVPRASPRDASKAKQVEAPASDERRAEAKTAAERPSLPAAPPAAAAKAAEAPGSRSDELSDGAAAARAGDSDRAYEEALGAYRDRRYDEAQRRFSDVASRGGDNAASAALYAAQSARARSGCPTATPLFDDVYRRYPDSPPGREAAWQAAGCYRTLGDFERARREYELLLQTPGYADRAQAALASLGDAEPSEVAARRAAPAASRDKGAAATGAAAPRAAGRPADNEPASPAKPSP